jgi:hypothetical protein
MINPKFNLDACEAISVPNTFKNKHTHETLISGVSPKFCPNWATTHRLRLAFTQNLATDFANFH